jgi:hypothetical protein
MKAEYDLNGGAPVVSAEGYERGRVWVDGNRIISIERWAPPAIITHRGPPLENVCEVIFQGGNGLVLAESEEDLLCWCREAKINAAREDSK